jgi:nucleotide-binding universal stress UspA family protein
MLKHVLVPLDGSPSAESALPYAEVLARRTGAALTLVRATPYASGPAQVRAIEDAEKYLTDLAMGLGDRGVNAEVAVPYGSPSTWIVEEVGLRKIDLIVMATHDRTGPDRWLHGSVAEAVVRHSGVPVFVVRAADGLRPTQRLDQSAPVLVVPLDGSPFAEAALPVACDLAGALNARLVLVGVVPAPGQLVAGDGAVVTYVAEDFEALAEDTRMYLSDVAARITPSPEWVMCTGDAATEIAAEAQARGAAAIVMATHGRTGLARSLLGSAAGHIMYQGATPLVLIRPGQLRASEVPAHAVNLAPV